MNLCLSTSRCLLFCPLGDAAYELFSVIMNHKAYEVMAINERCEKLQRYICHENSRSMNTWPLDQDRPNFRQLT